MLNLSNILSLSRAGFAFAFLQENIALRIIAIVLAMLTDFFDGFIARRWGTVTQFGAILDPIMDKFFVFFASGILYIEGSLQPWQLFTLLSRDISLCLFGLYLAVNRAWKGYECKAIWWGKITTVAQFFILIGLTCGYIFPSFVYLGFILMGILAFIELLTGFRRISLHPDRQNDLIE
jgi:CDP-diacylglycerol---glycerol-3-phosphate 3-phosphatidyltransferase